MPDYTSDALNFRFFRLRDRFLFHGLLKRGESVRKLGPAIRRVDKDPELQAKIKARADEFYTLLCEMIERAEMVPSDSHEKM